MSSTDANVTTKLTRHVRSYGAAYLLVVLHFGGAISAVAIVLSCVWLFAHFVWRRNVDLFLVFVLLVPSIVFVSTDPGAQDVASDLTIFNRFNSVVFVGPIALSTRLAFSLAIVTRVILRWRRIRMRALTAGWLLAVGLASVGLAYSFMAGNKNPSGLTVGLRIALSVGAVLVPRCVRDREDYVDGMDRILFLSMALLVSGLTGGHWLFIAFGLIPYCWMRFKPRILTLVPLVFGLRVLVLGSSTLTVLGIIISSMSFLLLLRTNRLTNNVLRQRWIMGLAIALPILLTVFVLRLPEDDARFDVSSVQGYAKFKLLGDRKPIWDASFGQMVNSSAFVVPAGTILDVYVPYRGQSLEWFAGSHNIFLETGRQVGLVGMVLLSAVMVVMLYRTGRSARTDDDRVLFYCLLSIYIVFGITGNDLVYDGVGAMYWLLVGQLYQTARPAVPSHSGQSMVTSTSRA